MEKSIKGKLEKLSNLYLIDIIKNYKKYNYDETTRETAIDILKKRNVPQKELEELIAIQKLKNSKQENKKENLIKYFNQFKFASIFCLIFYIIFILSRFILIHIFKNELTSIFIISLIILLYIIYFIFYIRIFIIYFSFYNNFYLKNISPFFTLLFFIIGNSFFPIFLVINIYDMKKKIKNL